MIKASLDLFDITLYLILLFLKQTLVSFTFISESCYLRWLLNCVFMSCFCTLYLAALSQYFQLNS